MAIDVLRSTFGAVPLSFLYRHSWRKDNGLHRDLFVSDELLPTLRVQSEKQAVYDQISFDMFLAAIVECIRSIRYETVVK